MNICAILGICKCDLRTTHTGSHHVLQKLRTPGRVVKDASTSKSSLEAMLVNLASIKS